MSRPEKTWAEKMPFKMCRCDHAVTLHAGGVAGCGFIGCKCPEFRERMTCYDAGETLSADGASDAGGSFPKGAPVEEPRTFQQVKEIMGGEVEF